MTDIFAIAESQVFAGFVEDRHRNSSMRLEQAVTPPSTYSTCPLTKLQPRPMQEDCRADQLLHVPHRPSGVRAESQARKFLVLDERLDRFGTKIIPAPARWRRRPCLPQSVAMPLVSIFTAPFEASSGYDVGPREFALHRGDIDDHPFPRGIMRRATACPTENTASDWSPHKLAPRLGRGNPRAACAAGYRRC